MLVSSTNSLWERTIVVVKWKTTQETNRWFVALFCCELQEREIRRYLMEIDAEMMLNGKSYRDIFSVFISKICSTLFKQNTDLSTHQLSTTTQWQGLSQKNRLKRPTFLLQRKQNKTFFLHSHIFIRKENSRKSILFQLTEIDENQLKRNSWVDLSNSLQLKNQRIKDENRIYLPFCWTVIQRKSSTLKNLFSPFSTIDFKQKIFKANIKWKDFLQFEFSKIFSRKKNQMNDVRIKDILDTSSNLFQIWQIFKWWTLFYEWIFHRSRWLNFD